MYDDKLDTIDRTKVSTLMVHWHPVPNCSNPLLILNKNCFNMHRWMNLVVNTLMLLSTKPKHHTLCLPIYWESENLCSGFHIMWIDF